LRLGCEAYAVELNPVAHIIELCTLVYPQKYGPSLVADVKKWGEWVIERAKAQLDEFYPSPPSQSKQHSDDNIVQTTLTGEQDVPQSNSALTPIAYLWTRTVPCPNPTCGATVPLVRQTWLRKKEGNYIALKMTTDHTAKKVLFERVQASTYQGLGFDPEIGSTRGNTVCLLCGATVNLDYIKQKGREGRMGQQLMVVIATREESKGKIYLDNVREEAYALSQEFIAQQIVLLSDKEKIDRPLEKLQDQDTLNIKLPLYGLTRFVDLFTPRQLLTLLVFSAQICRAHTYMLEEGVEPNRAAAITTYLGLLVDKLADRNSTVCRWDNSRETITNTYARQALPMVWDFAEANPFGGASGGIVGALKWMLEAIQNLVISGQPALVFRTSASQLPFENGTLDAVITDPPYYDNVSFVFM